MVKSGIKIFARIRPTKKATGVYETGEAEDGAGTLSFSMPRSEASGFVNNKRDTYTFRFNHVFDQGMKQDEVFETVARGVIDNCLEGYNGTIFAYGQTGSGKTFTITGGAERYADRGILPRTLSYLFHQFQTSPSTIYTTHISYLEIYNENGYDLLDPKHEASKLEDLPKVTLLEDSEGSIHLRNLSLHQATNEEEALNLLFLGDTNRMIAETPMNMASTRSHCIFTIHVSAREPGSDVIRRAKLHLVDLSGSERVGKSGVGGILLTEAKYINLSLHYLEQVIVALSEKSRSHIPYRNSMLTSVLRDSLGGNCMSTMIATCSVEKRNIDETISTCRFAQRVALVKNEALLNEELDPKLMVARLKQQVQELKEELVMATGEEREDELTQEERERCVELVGVYLQESSPEARLLVGGDMRKIQLCFQLMKAEVLKRGSGEHHSNIANPPQSSEEPDTPRGSQQEEPRTTASEPELQRLRELLKQRDNEISILLKILKQEKRRAAEAETALKEAGMEIRTASPILGHTSPINTLIASSAKAASTPGHGRFSIDSQQQPVPDPPTASRAALSPDHLSRSKEAALRSGEFGVSGEHQLPLRGGRVRQAQDPAGVRTALKAELSHARQEAFDSFRKTYADTGAIHQHKRTLKVKYAEAKALGERVNASRMAINKLKSQIEQHRISRGVQGLTDGSVQEGPDSREEELKRDIETEKANFKQLYGQLKELKSEIEHIQHLLEKARMQLQRDFEQWWTQQTSQQTEGAPPPTISAWRTPPSSQPPSAGAHNHPPSDHPTPRPPSSRRSRSQRAQAHVIAAHFMGESTQLSKDSSVPRPPMEGLSGMDSVGSTYERTKTDTSGVSSLDASSRNAGSNSLHSSGRYTHSRSQASNILHTGTRTSGGPIPYGAVLSLSNTERGAERVVGSLTTPQPLFGKEKTFNRLSLPTNQHGGSIPLTGDSKADADIIAFYKARQKLIQRGQPKR